MCERSDELPRLLNPYMIINWLTRKLVNWLTRKQVNWLTRQLLTSHPFHLCLSSLRIRHLLAIANAD